MPSAHQEAGAIGGASYAPGFGLRFLAFFGVALLASAFLAPLAKAGLDALVEVSPVTADLLRVRPTGEYDFGRPFRRLFLLVALGGAVAARGRFGAVPFLGVRRGERRWRNLLSGLAFAAASLSAVLVVLRVGGVRPAAFALPDGWPAAIAAAAVGGLAVGIVEESAVRGWLLGGLLRDGRRSTAVIVSSAVYSLAHFLKAEVLVEPGFRPLVGFHALVAQFANVARPEIVIPSIGYLMLGVVFSYSYLWSRSLPFVAGLHGGWVFLLAFDRMIVEAAGGHGYNPVRVLLGPIGWGVLLVCLTLLRLVLLRGARSRQVPNSAW